MAVAAPDMWSETALVAISKAGGTEYEYRTITKTVDISIGEKGFDVIANLAGGRLVKFNPQEPTEITLELYTVEATTSSGSAGAAATGVYDLMYTVADATEPISLVVDRTRLKVRCVILWTDGSAATATAVTVTPDRGYRIQAKNGYVTDIKEAFTDGEKVITMTMKFPPFDKDGTANITIESVDGSTTVVLPAITAYT